MKKSLPWMDIVLYPLVVVLAIWFGPRNTLWYAGLGFSLACAVLWFLALRRLGNSFAVQAEARVLVTGGLYSKIRHPVYVFGDLAYLGALLALQAWPALLIWLWVVGVDIRRARKEEGVLAEAFGDEYAAYRSRTWF